MAQDKRDANQGQQKLHTMKRTNPITGVVEEQQITQQRWREEGKTLRAEGWTRPDDLEATDEPV